MPSTARCSAIAFCIAGGNVSEYSFAADFGSKSIRGSRILLISADVRFSIGLWKLISIPVPVVGV